MLTHITERIIGYLQKIHRVLLVGVALVLAHNPASAVDGCLVLLCLGGDWQAIPMCVSPVQSVLDGLMHGHPFPTCDSVASSSASASMQWASAPDNCPVQYTYVNELESGTRYSCAWNGVVHVTVAGANWADVWWSMTGDSVTDYSDDARAKMAGYGIALDPRWDDDYTRWLAAHPPVLPSTCSGDAC